jgi:hypothetical protein
VTLVFNVTNDGRKAGTANVSFVAGPNAGFGGVQTLGQALLPDSDPFYYLFADALGNRAPQSENCQRSYLLSPGQSERAICSMLTESPLKLFGNFVAGQVTPLDDPSDGTRDNDTATDNRPPREALKVLPAPSAHIGAIDWSRGNINGSSEPLQVMAPDAAGAASLAAAAASKSPAAIRKVLVALVRVPSGAHAARASVSCKWLANRRGKFVSRPSKHGVCTGAVFLAATGTTHWHLTFRHPLPCGHYVAYATAIDNAGFREVAFSQKLGDRRASSPC